MSFTQNSVPAQYFVGVTPGVIETGPSGLTFTELMLTTSWRVPIGSLLSFGNAAAIDSYFGIGSNESKEGTVYFNGYNGATQLPTNLMFAQYNTVAVGAYLRGGPISSLTLAQLQTISGGLTLTIDGVVHGQTINLSAATSFTNAGQIINNAFGLTGPTQASCTGVFGATGTGTATGTLIAMTGVTGTIYPGTSLTAAIAGTGVPGGTYLVSQSSGTIGNNGTYVMSGTATASGTVITVTSDILTVSTVASGTLSVGEQITGSGVTTGTYITALGTNTTGGAGVYTTTQVQQVASEALTIVEPVISYDGISGAMVAISSTTGTVSTMSYATGTAAAPLDLTLATGAIISQGAGTATPATTMGTLTAGNPNFATFQTIFDPDGGSGNTQKQAFAAWAAGTNNTYAYITSDTDITPTETTMAVSSLGYILKQSNTGPAVLVWQPSSGYHLAAFMGGYAASINWNAPNGRASAAYKSQSGLTPTVTNEQVLENLIANGYNAYVTAATQGGSWQFMFPGSCLGVYNWFDSWLDQRYLNNQIQVALMTLLTSIGSIPFDPYGASIIRNTIAGGANPPVTEPGTSPVAQALFNGIIDVNVQLSSEQQQVVTNLVGQTNGANAIQSLQTQGWYLYIPTPTAQSRGQRIWPGIILLYCDGGSVNQIDISSLAVQ